MTIKANKDPSLAHVNAHARANMRNRKVSTHTANKQQQIRSEKGLHLTMKLYVLLLSIHRCAHPHIHNRQKSISRLSYFCREHYLGSAGKVPVFSSVSSGCHCSYTNSPLSSLARSSPFPPNPLFHCHCSLALSLCCSYIHTHTHTPRLFVFPLGRTTVAGESIYWQDKESGWCESTRPHSAQQTLKWSAGLEFQTKCPLIHYTCNCTENLLPQCHLLHISLSFSLSLSLCLSRPLSLFPSIFFPLFSHRPSSFSLIFSRQSIHKVWIKLMTSRAALWKSHCRKKPYITVQKEPGWKKKKTEKERERKECVRSTLFHSSPPPGPFLLCAIVSY